jgi:hypothetical protein
VSHRACKTFLAQALQGNSKGYIRRGVKSSRWWDHIPSPSNGVNPAMDDIKTMFPCADL